MIHLAAIVLGVLVVAAASGFFYVIHSVLKHFGLNSEDVFLTIFGIAIVAAVSWFFGTITLELIGLL